MKYDGKLEKACIFSKQKWDAIQDTQKVRILKSFEKEIASDLGIKKMPRLVFANILANGNYEPRKNVLTLNKGMVLEGLKTVVRNVGMPNPNSNIDTLFALCHELEHVAQRQRVQGKIAWRTQDDQDGIAITLKAEARNGMLPYINGMAKAEHVYELYRLQPAEYGANQSALNEIRGLLGKYSLYCSNQDIKESTEKIEVTHLENETVLIFAKKLYPTSDIVQDISHCLQNMFAGTRYHVPLDLRQDVENACGASYRYMCSEQYMQREALLKKEINYELAKQEYER